MRIIVEQFLKWATKIVIRYPLLIIGISLIITGFFIIASFNLKTNTSWLFLMPENDPTLKEYNRINKTFGSIDTLMIILEGDLESSKQLAEKIAEELQKMPKWVKNIYYKIDINFFEKHGLLFLDINDLSQLKKNIQENKEFLQRIFSDVHLLPFFKVINDDFEDEKRYREFQKEEELLNDINSLEKIIKISQQATELGKNLRYSKVKEAVDDFLLRGQERQNEERVDEDYFVSEDGSMLMIMVQPTRSANDMTFTQEFMNQIKQKITPLAKQFSPTVKVGYAGPPPLYEEELKEANEDLLMISVIAFIGICALFILMFRRASLLFLIGVPLIMNIIWTLGITTLVIGHLNIVSYIFAAVLLGVGDDFMIHMIYRYTEERSQGRTIEEATTLAICKTGKGIFTGCITCAVAFYVLMVSDFRGFSETGFILGSGMLCYLLITFFVLPSILILKDKKIRGIKVNYFHMSKIRVLENILVGVAKQVTDKPKLVALSLIIFTIIMCFFAKDIKFEYDYLEYEPRNIPSLILQYKIMEKEKFGMSPDYIATLADNIEQCHLISSKLKSLDSIKMVDSISNFLPEAQDKKIPLLLEINKEIASIEVLRAPSKNEQFSQDVLKDFIAEIKRLNLNLQESLDMAFIAGYVRLEDKIQQLLSIISDWLQDLETYPQNDLLSNLSYYQSCLGQALKDRLELFKTMTLSKGLTIDEIPENIKKWYIGADGSFIVSAFPKKNIWDKISLEKLNRETTSIAPHMTGSTIMYLSAINQISKDYILMIILLLLTTFFLIWFNLKSLRFTLVSFIPLIFGTAWMLGCMSILNIKYNLVNIMAIPLIFGLCVDETIHVVFRFIEEKFATVKTMTSVGMPIFITSLTTLVGLGGLCFASHRGLASLGYVITIGVIFYYIATITILPAILKIMFRK